MVAASAPRLEKSARQTIRAKGERFVMVNLKSRWAETDCACRRTLAPPITTVLRFANGSFILGSHRREFNRKLPLKPKNPLNPIQRMQAIGPEWFAVPGFRGTKRPAIPSSSYLTHSGQVPVVPRMVPPGLTPFWVGVARRRRFWERPTHSCWHKPHRRRWRAGAPAWAG